VNHKTSGTIFDNTAIDQTLFINKTFENTMRHEQN